MLTIILIVIAIVILCLTQLDKFEKFFDNVEVENKSTALDNINEIMFYNTFIKR